MRQRKKSFFETWEAIIKAQSPPHNVEKVETMETKIVRYPSGKEVEMRKFEVEMTLEFDGIRETVKASRWIPLMAVSDADTAFDVIAGELDYIRTSEAYDYVSDNPPDYEMDERD